MFKSFFNNDDKAVIRRVNLDKDAGPSKAELRAMERAERAAEKAERKRQKKA